MIGVIRSDGWWRFACGDVLALNSRQDLSLLPKVAHGDEKNSYQIVFRLLTKMANVLLKVLGAPVIGQESRSPENIGKKFFSLELKNCIFISLSLLWASHSLPADVICEQPHNLETMQVILKFYEESRDCLDNLETLWTIQGSPDNLTIYEVVEK